MSLVSSLSLVLQMQAIANHFQLPKYLLIFSASHSLSCHPLICHLLLPHDISTLYYLAFPVGPDDVLKSKFNGIFSLWIWVLPFKSLIKVPMTKPLLTYLSAASFIMYLALRFHCSSHTEPLSTTPANLSFSCLLHVV